MSIMPSLLLAPSATPARAGQAARSCSARPFQAGNRAPSRALFFQARLVAKAAEAEEIVGEGNDEQLEAQDAEALNAVRLARLEAEVGQQAEASMYSLNFLWLDKQIGVAVDQVFKKGQRSPVTEFFFWPRKDAWEELNVSLQTKGWIAEADRVALLNKCTEVINYWQDENEKHTMAQAQEKFEDCKFVGC